MVKKITLQFHEYPQEKPENNCYSLYGITKEGDFRSVYYNIDDSKHEHSIWNKIKFWITEKELVDQLKGDLK